MHLPESYKLYLGGHCIRKHRPISHMQEKRLVVYITSLPISVFSCLFVCFWFCFFIMWMPCPLFARCLHTVLSSSLPPFPISSIALLCKKCQQVSKTNDQIGKRERNSSLKWKTFYKNRNANKNYNAIPLFHLSDDKVKITYNTLCCKGL